MASIMTPRVVKNWGEWLKVESDETLKGYSSIVFGKHIHHQFKKNSEF